MYVPMRHVCFFATGVLGYYACHAFFPNLASRNTSHMEHDFDLAWILAHGGSPEFARKMLERQALRLPYDDLIHGYDVLRSYETALVLSSKRKATGDELLA